jgi:NAD(P)-dependent dehydrogenase (short-subunit alcohol dehydrogenase family)
MILDRRNAHIVEEINEYMDQAFDILITLETLEPSFPLIGMCRTILCLDECLGESIRLKVTRSDTQKIESLNTKQILDRRYVGKKLSKIVSWLRNRYNDFTLDSEPSSSQHSYCKDTEWNIPCQSVTLLGERGLLLPVCSPLNRLFKRSNVYIVTGGLTGLGWEITRFLAEMGAGIIVSLSRRDVSVDKAREIEIEENKSGCKIFCVKCDVTSLNSVQTSMKEIQQKTMGNAIKGVFHGAGILNGHMLMNLDEKSLDEVLKPKVIGTLNMHIATRDMNLDFFVVQSSVNAIIGSPGQNSYGAANAFLDTFMEWRRQNGLPGQAINWGSLAVGMAARPEFVANFEKRGFNLLSVSEIRTCFQEALLQNSTGVIYANINWDTFAKDYTGPYQVRARLQMSVLFEEVTSTFKGFANDDSFQISFDIEALVAAGEEGQRFAIRQMLNIVARRVIGGYVGEVVHTSTLTELSFDSMSTVTFISIVQDITTYKIPPGFMGDTSHTLEDVENLLFDNIFKIVSNEISDEERPVSLPDKMKILKIEYPDIFTPLQT